MFGVKKSFKRLPILGVKKTLKSIFLVEKCR